jgi:hexosaminidase
VPALESWRGGQGSFELRHDARVVVRSRDRGRLWGEARTLATDLARRTGLPIEADTGGWARRGDVLLTRVRSHRLGSEGYRLRIGASFEILAPTRAGAFYGGRTLLQLVAAGRRIRRGRAIDRPLYPQRALMIDNGRRFYPRAWLERRIAELADLKLNVLHLHLSDNEGFRIESRSHPEAVTAPFLSRADVARLVAVARRRHVTLVPEIDAPGHMRAALRAHPELQLADAAGVRQPDKLDVTSVAARRFVFDLIDELAPQFPDPVWHTGADEYLGVVSGPEDYARYPRLVAYARARHGPRANGKDAVLDFVEAVRRRVARHGKRLRVWSDGVGGGGALHTDPRVSVMWWEERHSPLPSALVRAGHRVLNAGWWPTYHVTGGPLSGLRTPLDEMYEAWRPWEFTGPYTVRWAGDPSAPPTDRVRRGHPRQLGASVQVWNDDPEAPGGRPAVLARELAPRLRVLAQKTWGSPELAGRYRAFERLLYR